MRYINGRVFTQGSALWGIEKIFSHRHNQNHQKPHYIFGHIRNGKPMGNTYSLNCMMHRDKMLKFGTLFDLAKYIEHT